MKTLKALYEGTKRVYSDTYPGQQDMVAVGATGTIAYSIARQHVTSGAVSTFSTGRLSFVAIPLLAGQVITNITLWAGGTAGATLTHTWFCLYSGALAKLQVTVDDTSASWSANTAKTLALASPYTVVTTGLHYVGACVVGTTVPTTYGNASYAAAFTGIAPAMGGASTGSLTTPSTAPATAGAITGLTGIFYTYLT